VFQERYGHRGSSEPASVNIIDLTCGAKHILISWTV